jgi:hypothetical protein
VGLTVSPCPGRSLRKPAATPKWAGDLCSGRPNDRAV